MIIFKLLTYLLGGFWALKAKCQDTQSDRLKNLYIHLYKLNQRTIVSDIDYRAHFESSPFFPHRMHGVFISRWARIGRGCVIMQNVTIGSNLLPDSKGLGAPTIGDHCFIGAGAAIIGNCTVGNNVRIGANCVVTQDVPDDSIVVSNIQRIIQKDHLDNRYYVCRGEWGYHDDDHDWHEETDSEILRRFASRLRQ